MNPLTWILAMLAGTVTGGPFLVAAFALGHYGWAAILLSLGLAAFGAVALGHRIEREIKRQDPAWDERRDRARPLPVLRPRGDAHPERFDPRRHWRH